MKKIRSANSYKGIKNWFFWLKTHNNYRPEICFRHSSHAVNPVREVSQTTIRQTDKVKRINSKVFLANKVQTNEFPKRKERAKPSPKNKGMCEKNPTKTERLINCQSSVHMSRKHWTGHEWNRSRLRSEREEVGGVGQ